VANLASYYGDDNTWPENESFSTRKTWHKSVP
jgi:hypothetical protein